MRVHKSTTTHAYGAADTGAGEFSFLGELA